ncbi:MAG: hydantoinase B/oxoprolinase family protein, partial [Casimicrobiaceae bacterium]
MIPRELRVEVNERLDAQGHVITAPVDADIEKAVRFLKDSGARAIAVCFLHSFTNPAHEERVKEIARRVAPEVAVSLSSEVLGELREYERTMATVLNAYVMPMIGGYLAAIEDGLRAFGIAATLRIMQSNGGVISREFGERMPIRMLESGPAAGALGAAHAARLAKKPNVIAFDMGGTTAKACLVIDGKPSITNEFEAARVQRFKKGSGLPVRLPTVDLIEIGAGGGSIAHVDATGLLKVGPQSAGSSPGPACYGLGGMLPTVTDAALVLGYLDPEGNLSGAVRMHSDLAAHAIEKHVARPLGLTVIEAASGIHRIVCEQMATAAKIHAVENGRDVRRYTLLAFGGAGPIHAREVARRTGCTEILVPANAGVFSAFGLLVAPMKVDMVRTRFARLADVDWSAAEAFLSGMEETLRAELAAAGVPSSEVSFRRAADMRYTGQGFEVETEMPAHLIADARPGLETRFKAAYAARFGKHLENQSIEVVNWRVEGFAAAPATAQRPRFASGPKAGAAPVRMRPAFFPDLNAFVRTPVWAESAFVCGEQHDGPALIEQAGSTVVVGPGDRFGMDECGNLRITTGVRTSRAAQSEKGGRDMNPIDLEIYWNRLIAITDEAGAALKRTSFSTVVRESNDFACVLLDTEARLVAQSTLSIPGFIGTAPLSLTEMLKVFPKATLGPGDILFTNDPWVGTGHLPDATMAAPIFANGKLVAFAIAVAHLSDVGGRQWSADASELYEEGIRFPVIKVAEGGRLNPLVMHILQTNARLPQQVKGDIEAQVSALSVTERRLVEMLAEYGLSGIDDIAAAIFKASEDAALRELRRIPPGIYTGSVDSDGFDERVSIKAAITVTHEGVSIDYAGSTPQVRYGINETFNHTYAYTIYPFKCLLSPGIPNNDGFTRLFKVSAPEGTIVNARPPAAVGA